MAGLDDSGFTARRASDLRDTIQSELEAQLGSALDFDRDTVLGQVVAVLATLLGDAEEAIQAVYDGRDLNNATGIQLDNLARINGLVREPATRTSSVVTFVGDVGVPVPIQTVVAGPDDTRYETRRDARCGAIALFASAPNVGQTYEIELQPSGGPNVQATVTAQSGETAADVMGRLEVEARANFPDDYEIRRRQSLLGIERDDRDSFGLAITQGSGQLLAQDRRVLVDVEAVEVGRVVPSDPGINTIVTPVDGVTGVTENTSTRALGQDLESDADLRARIIAAQQSRGSVATAAITANILDDVTAVDSALTLENDQNTSQGVQGVTLAANSIRTYIYPNLSSEDEEAVLRTIYETRTAGIECDASDVTGTVQDASQTDVAFNYATEIEIEVEATVTLASGVTISQVDDAYEDAIRDYIEQLTIGEDISDLQVKARGAAIDGIVSISTVYKDSGGITLATDADVSITTDGIAVEAAAGITVTT